MPLFKYQDQVRTCASLWSCVDQSDCDLSRRSKEVKVRIERLHFKIIYLEFFFWYVLIS